MQSNLDHDFISYMSKRLLPLAEEELRRIHEMKNKKAVSKKQPKLQFGQAVEVEWLDCTGSGGWASLHEMPLSPTRVSQVGYFLMEDDEAVHLCQGIPNEEEGCSHQIIGPCAIPK